MLIEIKLGSSTVHIDTALNASVSFERNDLFLRAAPAQDTAAVADKAPTPTPVLVQSAKNKKMTRPLNHLEKVRSGLGPIEICRLTGVLPPSLRICIQGRNYYRDFGGSAELWDWHYSIHKHEWDQIAAHADWIPPAAGAPAAKQASASSDR